MVARKPAATQVEKTEPAAVVVSDVKISNDMLRSVTSVEDAMALAAELYGGVTTIDELEIGSGFTILQNKDRLLGTPFLVLHVDEHFGDFGQFVTALCITTDGTNARCVVNDGSTGFAEHLREMVRDTGKKGGFMLSYGLRKSVYDVCPNCGNPLNQKDVKGPITTCHNCQQDVGGERNKGTTYYVRTSAEEATS